MSDLEAATETAALSPDIVLLQESPSRAGVESLARTLNGKGTGALWGIDGSVVVRGTIRSRLRIRRAAITAHLTRRSARSTRPCTRASRRARITR